MRVQEVRGLAGGGVLRGLAFRLGQRWRVGRGRLQRGRLARIGIRMARLVPRKSNEISNHETKIQP